MTPTFHCLSIRIIQNSESIRKKWRSVWGIFCDPRRGDIASRSSVPASVLLAGLGGSTSLENVVKLRSALPRLVETAMHKHK